MAVGPAVGCMDTKIREKKKNWQNVMILRELRDLAKFRNLLKFGRTSAKSIFENKQNPRNYVPQFS
jgi:hypothetical protein